MLTSPMNVTIPTPNGASLKAHGTGADASAGKNSILPAANVPAPEVATIGPELPSNSVLTSVNAMAATVASRTVLQDVTLNLANLLQLTRNDDENLTALFIRIIAAIEGMPQSERLQTEIRSGLKGMKITLWELAAALRNPDGAEAARLTAMVEAPLATPGKTSANAATSTYLQQGTANGHTEETLAMRAAARSNAAGLGLFSPENKARASDHIPGDAKGLQTQLKTLFEPGASERKVAANPAPVAGSETRLATTASTMARADGTMIHAANLKIDTPTAEKLHDIAKAIVEERLDAKEIKAEAKLAEKAEAADHRVQTLLTLKGFAEVITSLPGRAAELFTALPDAAHAAEPGTMPNPADLKAVVDADGSTEFPGEIPLSDAEHISERSVTASHGNPVSDTVDDDAAEVEAAHRKSAAAAQQNASTPAESNPATARPAVTHEGVPFAYAVLQPAKDAFAPKVEEEDTHDRDEQDSMSDEDQSDGEKRRPRDEYDAMKDPQPEEEPAIVITRDSSGADRAFALYQRMGGF
ncbi:hypothetical protein IHQ71_02515 [Rhizobium sp. TH2]|nr:hypothetical protein IHQ71_02515 [Rhizobium sp. TH2]